MLIKCHVLAISYGNLMFLYLFIEVQLAMTILFFCMFVVLIIIYNLCEVITFNGSEIKN